MGKCTQGVFGMWTGKTGNVVGRIRQGQNVYSIYQPNVSNPQTVDQQFNRAKFRMASKFFSVCLQAVSVGFKTLDGYKRGSAFSAALGKNFAEMFTGTTISNLALKFDKILVANGAVPMALNPSGQLDGNDLQVVWVDNSGMGKALSTDKPFVVAYNASKQICMVAARGERQGMSATLALPSVWNGDTVEGYLFFSRADESESSDSFYLGSFNL